MEKREEVSALVLLMATLLTHDHQIVEDEQRPFVSLTKVGTSAQVQNFIDVELQNKMTLGGGEFLEGRKGRGEREREGERGGERETEREYRNVFQASLHITGVT